MYVQPSRVLIFGLLLTGVGHVMIIQNGFWNNLILLITIPSVVIIVTLYQYLKNNEKRKKIRKIKNYSDI